MVDIYNGMASMFLRSSRLTRPEKKNKNGGRRVVSTRGSFGDSVDGGASCKLPVADVLKGLVEN